jgi:hypothetical protein
MSETDDALSVELLKDMRASMRKLRAIRKAVEKGPVDGLWLKGKLSELIQFNANKTRSRAPAMMRKALEMGDRAHADLINDQALHAAAYRSDFSPDEAEAHSRRGEALHERFKEMLARAEELRGKRWLHEEEIKARARWIMAAVYAKHGIGEDAQQLVREALAEERERDPEFDRIFTLRAEGWAAEGLLS